MSRLSSGETRPGSGDRKLITEALPWFDLISSPIDSCKRPLQNRVLRVEYIFFDRKLPKRGAAVKKIFFYVRSSVWKTFFSHSLRKNAAFGGRWAMEGHEGQNYFVLAHSESAPERVVVSRRYARVTTPANLRCFRCLTVLLSPPHIPACPPPSPLPSPPVPQWPQDPDEGPSIVDAILSDGCSMRVLPTSLPQVSVFSPCPVPISQRPYART